MALTHSGITQSKGKTRRLLITSAFADIVEPLHNLYTVEYFVGQFSWNSIKSQVPRVKYQPTRRKNSRLSFASPPLPGLLLGEYTQLLCIGYAHVMASWVSHAQSKYC